MLAIGRLYSSALYLKNSSPIFGFNELLPKIVDEYDKSSKERPIRLETLKKLGRMINGFRPAELTIFSGPTGSGKTTCLSQISLDYCFQGVRTLWGSFEIKSSRLGQIMIHQTSSETIPFINDDRLIEKKESIKERLEKVSHSLSSIPLYFMSYFGPTPISDILETMYEAARIQGIQHIVLDNLQFILSDQFNRFDKFELADRALASIREFCNNTSVHVTLVIHPRKEDDNAPLGIASLSGTSKASQEADNIIFIQKLDAGMFIDVKKNRYEGTLGRVRIEFDPMRKIVYEASSENNQNVEGQPGNLARGLKAA